MDELETNTNKNWFSTHRLLGILFVVVALAAVISGIYYWKTVSAIPDNEAVPGHQVKSDEMKDWNTYSSVFFTINYPKEYSVEKENFQMDKSKPHYGYGGIILGKVVTPNNYTIDVTRIDFGADTWFDKAEAQFESDKASPQDTLTHITVAGHDAMREYVSGYDSQTKEQGFTSLEVDLPLGDFGYVFEFRGTSNDKSEIEQFDQAVSTFKFTDSISAVDTSAWKTYTNTQYGFEFKYPSTINLSETGSESSSILLNDKTFLWMSNLDAMKAAEKSCNDSMGECMVSPTSEDYSHDLALYNKSTTGSVPCDYESYGNGKDWRSGYTCELVQVGNNKFLLIYETGGAPYGIPTKDYIIYKDNIRYDFVLQLDGGIGEQSRSDFDIQEKTNPWASQFNQILSTFKFTK